MSNSVIGVVVLFVEDTTPRSKLLTRLPIAGTEFKDEALSRISYADNGDGLHTVASVDDLFSKSLIIDHEISRIATIYFRRTLLFNGRGFLRSVARASLENNFKLLVFFKNYSFHIIERIIGVTQIINDFSRDGLLRETSQKYIIIRF